MKFSKKGILVLCALSMVLAVNAEHQEGKKRKKDSMHKKYRGTVAALWRNTPYSLGGESYILLARTEGNAFGPTRILGKEAGAQPKTALHIAAGSHYKVFIKNVDSFAVPVTQKAKPNEYRWVMMDRIFEVIQHAASTENTDNVMVEATDRRVIVLDPTFVQALINDFANPIGFVRGSVDLTNPADAGSIEEYAG